MEAAKQEEFLDKQNMVLREHEPLTHLLSLIPRKIQKGMLGTHSQLNLICIDAMEDFIALGSNVGILFLYDRNKGSIERLKSESSNDTVTCVKLHHGLDYQVAFGISSGAIYIFQLPSMLIGHSKQLLRVVVADLHTSPLTSIAWSHNGMRVYSGDKAGRVGETQVDFLEGQCKSSVLLVEPKTEIVQLCHDHKSVLISTLHRCVIWPTSNRASTNNDGGSGLIQVGQTDRKIPLSLGACFIPGLCKPEDAQLYAARPGLRIWKAKMDGSVSSTLIFKDLLTQPHGEIQVLPFDMVDNSLNMPSQQFGPLLEFCGKLLVTWNETCLYIINPENISIIGTQRHMGTIRGVAVSREEIFVLRSNTNRNVVRLAYQEEEPRHRISQVLLAAQMLRSEGKGSFNSETNEKELQKHSGDERHSKQSLSRDHSPLPLKKVLDKVRQIPIIIPSLIKTSALESSSPSSSSSAVSLESRYGHGYVFEKDKEESGDNMDDLPPIIPLSSLSGLNSVLDRQDSSVSLENSSLEISLDISNRDIILRSSYLDVNQSSNQTQIGIPTENGSRNSSHSDIHSEEKSKTLPKLGKMEAKLSNQAEEGSVDKSLLRGSKFLLDYSEEDSIVFKKKKSKVKKRKKGARNQETRGSSDHEKSGDCFPSDSLDIGPDLEIDPQKSSVDDSNFDQIQDLDIRTKNGDFNPSDQSSSPVIPLHQLAVVRTSNKKVLSQSDDAGKTKEESDTKRDKESVTLSDGINLRDTSLKTALDNAKTKKLATPGSLSKSNKLMKDQAGIDKSSDCPLIDQVSTDKLNVSSSHVKHEEEGSAQQSDLRSLITPQKYQINSKERVSSNTGDDHRVKYLTSRVSSLEKEIRKLDLEVMRMDSNVSDTLITQTQTDDVGMARLDTPSDAVNTVQASQLVCSNDVISDTQTNDSKAKKPDDSTKSQSLYQTPDTSSEDFYSKFYISSVTPSSTQSVSPESDPLSLTAQTPKVQSPEMDKRVEERQVPQGREKEDTDNVQVVDFPASSDVKNSVNIWTQFTALSNVYSMALSDMHIWYTDKSNNIYYSPLHQPGLTWRKAIGSAKQIAVSQFGDIVWCLQKNTVLAGTKITQKHPEGLKWVEAVKEVTYIAVDNNSAWYIKVNGEVMMQTGLSRERPCFRSIPVPCSYRLKQIVCRNGVVWALTETCRLIYRNNITSSCPHGTDWVLAEGENLETENLFSTVALGDGGLGWAMNVLGQLFFCTGVTMKTPIGDQKWWQVLFNTEYLIQDMTTLDMLKALPWRLDPQRLPFLLSNQTGGLICTGRGQVCVCLEYKNIIHVCHGSLEGHLWEEAHPMGIAASTAWKIVEARNADAEEGIIWGLQPNGGLFTFPPDRLSCFENPRPAKLPNFVCMSACQDAFWALSDIGDIYIRTGMGPHCPEGYGWEKLDLCQLADNQLIHVSCGQQYVWAVDSDGDVFQRIGVRAPSTHGLNAAWLPVDRGGTVFTHIKAGPQDWMVWAIDNRRQVYVRSGVTDRMPVGRTWIHVPGTQAVQLTISERHVWALNPAGELLCRFGISQDNCAGDYWKRVPGSFVQVSASPSDELWGINRDGQVIHRQTKYIIKKEPVSKDPNYQKRTLSVGSEEGDWELI
ncbi:hypothetical protein CHS0354_004340 [Potamilus streckersoni]|uniref:Tectonin beta-propeller repeat-containing protein 2 n=1 Tax=Potamilus streckersoni TaxID=2493646 RepID=A0AAE0SG06_9BIVA|nr:hypothetical protein CHS0354_004340 [Potamilus streckersoni]